MSHIGSKGGGIMKKALKIGGIVLVVLIVISIFGNMIGSDDNNPEQTAETEASQVKEAVESMDALDQMEVAFIGNPSKSDIKEKLDVAFGLYDTEITEENYSRAGSTLIALRQESKTGVTEMEILDYMIRSHVEDVNMSFPDMAGISFSALETGDN